MSPASCAIKLNTALFPPSQQLLESFQQEQEPSLSKPTKSLQLKFVYGAGAKGVQGNLLYLNKRGELVFPAAATAVIYDTASHTQRTISQVHDDDITCVAQHPDGNTFATGQTGKDDYVLVWDSISEEILAKVDTSKEFNPGGVLALSFNPRDPSQLAIVGGTDHQCSLQVWDWKARKVIASAPVSKKETHALAWSPQGDIVWMGNGEIKFIHFESPSQLKVHSGIMGKKGTRQRFLSVDFAPNGDVLIGTQSGMIYRFVSRKLVSKKRAHKGTVRTIITTKKGFISGGKDGNIKVWQYGAPNKNQGQEDFDEEDFEDEDVATSEFNIVNTYRMGDYTRSVTVNEQETLAYVFESDGDVLQLDLTSQEKEQPQVKPLLHGHNGSRTELWGLDVSSQPEKPYLVTAGDDGRILLYNYETRRLLGQIASKKNKFRGVAFSPNTENIAVTSLDGDLFIVSVDNLMESKLGKIRSIDTSKSTDLEIAVVKFSPCGKYLAVGSHDTNIYVYSCRRNYAKVATLSHHSGAILAVDWSKDSRSLRSVCAAKELLYWHAGSDFSRDEVSKNKTNLNWASESCIFTWGVRGMWSAHEDYNDASDINACDVDFTSNHLAFVDDLGKVNLCRYPTLHQKVPVKSYMGHCSHVTRCRFSCDGKYLFSAGGADLCCFQWECVDKSGR